MKRFVLSVFLLFAGFFVFAQSIKTADWEKVFSENKKENIEETISAVGVALETADYPQEMFDLFTLYYAKCDIAYIQNTENKNDTDYKEYYNSEYDKSVKTYPDFEKNTKVFINYIIKNDYVFMNVKDFKKYKL